MKRLLIPLLLLAFLSACERVSPDPRDDDRFVVEGWIDNGGCPVVMLTSPAPAVKQENAIEDLGRYLIRGAEVLVSDDLGNEVRLQLQHDSRYLPPYIYTTDRMRGIPGHRYRLEVRYLNRTATAETLIPEPVELEKLEVSAVNESDTLRGLWAYFPQPPSQDVCYRFFLQVEGKDDCFLPAMVSGVEKDGETTGIPLMRGNNLFNKNLKHPLWFKPGEVVHVKFCTVERPVWAFWKSYDELNALGKNPFFPINGQINSNVDRAYGYWAGYGATYRTVTIE